MGVTGKLVADSAIDGLDYKVGRVKAERLRVADVERNYATSTPFQGFGGTDNVTDGIDKVGGTF
jgi:hypothetical protein